MKRYLGIVVFLSALLLITLILNGCTLGPNFTKPPAPSQKGYVHSDPEGIETVPANGTKQHFDLHSGLNADWWKLFHSSQINHWVDQSLAGNQSLEAAQASLRRSQDIILAGKGILYPQVNASLSASRERNVSLIEGTSRSSSQLNFSTFSGAVSYVLDIFGLERRTIEGLEAVTEAQKNITRAVFLNIESSIVHAAIAKAALEDILHHEQSLLFDLSVQKQLIEGQAKAGMTAYTSLLSISENLESRRAEIDSLEQKRDQNDHFIASLLGQDLSSTSLPAISLDSITLPMDLPLSLPSELVRQRPDILIAEAQMHIDSASVGVATAMMWPSVSLSGGGGIIRPEWNLLNAPSQKFWSIGPSMNLPVFTGGSLMYQKEAAVQQLVKSEAQYRQTVLDAFSNVADALTALQHDAHYSAALDQVKADAALTHSLTLKNYQAGLIDYGSVLTTQILLEQAQINNLEAYAQRLQDTVSLLVSLGGGGWDAAVVSP